jgi:hypothetical protein
MPKVLTRLRIDEISAVDRAAGEGCKVVLYKRHDLGRNRPRVFGYGLDEPPPSEPSFYAKLFAEPKAERAKRLHREARRQRAALTSKQHSEAPMSTSTDTLLKILRGMDEHTFVKLVTSAAKAQHPELSGPQAFTKVFCEDSGQGAAIRAAHAIVKARGAIGGPVDSPIGDNEPDDDEGDDADALDELEELAEQERRRNPGMSKSVAFTKVYTDPANARLAQAERRQNRPRA